MAQEKQPSGADLISKAKHRLKTHSKGKSVSSKQSHNNAIELKEVRHVYNKTTAENRMQRPQHQIMRMQGVTS